MTFGVIFFLVYIIQYTDGIFRVGSGVFPQIMLPITVYCGMFWDDKIGAIYGFLLGSLVDAVSANTICYNSIMLMLIGYSSGLLITHIINNNFRSSLILSLAYSVIYYFGCWCISGFSSDYILRIYPKVILYTLFISIPVYLGIKLIINLRKKSFSK